MLSNYIDVATFAAIFLKASGVLGQVSWGWIVLPFILKEGIVILRNRMEA